MIPPRPTQVLTVLAALAGTAAFGCDGLFGVDFDDARPRPVSSGVGAGGGGAGAAGGGGGGDASAITWTRLPLVEGSDGVPHATSDVVMAIWCQSVDRCLIAANGGGASAGNLYAATHQQVTALLVEGGPLGFSFGFFGISPTPDGAVARHNYSKPLVRAQGDFMSSAAWTITDPGELWGLGTTQVSQLLFQTSDAGARFLFAGMLLTTDFQPAVDTVWTRRWDPPEAPTNWLSLKLADELVCDSGPTVKRGATGFVSDDLQLIAYPAGEALDDEYAGACVSTDSGKLFRYAPLPAGEVAYGGPTGMRCLDASHCWLIGQDGASLSPYVFYGEGTLGAAGASATSWHRAAILSDGAERTLHDIAFAPDGLRGWAVGREGPGRGLLLASEDGGRTWGDNLVAALPELQGVALYSVFAVDAQHLLIGGDQGLLMSATFAR